jgi:hypothetical protein
MALLAACSAALVAAASTVAVYQWRPGMRLGMDRQLPPGVRGFYGLERQGKTGFAWSGGSVRLEFAHVDRRVPWKCRADIINWRSPAAGPARVRVRSEGTVLLDRQVGEPSAVLAFAVPASPGHSAIDIAIDVAPTFRPGPQDPRDLGLAFDAISCDPEEGSTPWPSPAVVARGAAAAAMAGVVIGLAGLPALVTLAASAGLALAQSWSLASGGAAHSLTSPPVFLVAGLFGLFCLLPVAMAAGLLRKPLSAAARLAVVVSACGFYVKLIFLLHPDKDLVDAVFHAHRFDWVLAGRFYFTQLSTSATPFPYAIGLYAFSSPWSLLTADHVTLLRVVVCASEAAAGALLYPLILRAWNDRETGVMAVLLFHLLPLPYAVIGNANLTNVFAQSAALVTMIAAISWAFEPRGAPALAGLTALAGLAFLSHVGTLAFLLPTLLILAALFYVAPGRAFRKPALCVLAAAGLALVVAVGLYYGHFGSVYRPHLEKARAAVTGAAGADSAHPAGASVPSRPEPVRKAPPLQLGIRGALGQTRGSLGWPISVLALAGAGCLLARRRADRLVLGLGAWALAGVVFLGWSVVRTVDPLYVQDAWEFIGRVELAISPAAAVLAARGATWAWRSGPVPRAAGALLIGAAVWVAAGSLGAWIF